MSETSSGATAARAVASTAARFGAAGDELVPRRRPCLLDRDAHDVRAARAAAVGGRRSAALSRPRNAPDGEQQRRRGAGQDVGGLAGGVAGVERDEHAAGVVRRQARHHPVLGVRRPDRDPVAGLDAEVDHRRGGLPDLGEQLGVGQASCRP